MKICKTVFANLKKYRYNADMRFFLYFLTGTIIGSFINMMSSRLVLEKSLLKTRSECDKCNKKIIWYDLMPILSYLLLQGKCRYCKTKIPAYYPVVELLFGFIALWLFSHESITIQSMLKISFVALLSINSITDILVTNIYNKALYPLMVVALLLSIISGNIVYQLIQALILTVLIWVMAKGIGAFKQEKSLGEGDYYIFFCIGLLFSYEGLIRIIMISSLIGIMIALFIKRKSLPFVPLLQIGIMGAYLWS